MEEAPITDRAPRAWSPEEVREWATDLAARRAWVLHETLAVGPVAAFHDGVEQRWRSPVNGVEVEAPVLELATGHALIANPDKFVEMSAAEFRFYAALQQGLVGLVALGARSAASAGVEQQRGIVFVVAALRAQLAALEAKEST